MGTYKEEVEKLAEIWDEFDQALNSALDNISKILSPTAFWIIKKTAIYIAAWAIVAEIKRKGGAGTLWDAFCFFVRRPFYAIRVARNVNKVQKIYGNHEK